MLSLLSNVPRRTLLSLSLSLLCNAFVALAQETQFLTAMSLTEANFTQSEQSRWQYLSQGTDAMSIQLVRVGDLPSFIEEGKLPFSIPGGPANLEAEANFIREEANGDFTWWASLTNETGYIGVTRNEAGTYACVQKDQQFWKIHALSERYNALVEVRPDTSAAPSCLPAPPLPDDVTTNPDDCDAMSDCRAVVSVLVLVTPEAANALGFNGLTIESMLYLPLGMHSANFALQNSAVFGKTFRFIVEPYAFDFTPANSLITPDLVRLRDDPNAHALRTAHKADLMVLLTNDRYSDALGAWYETFSGPWYFGIVSIEHLFGVRNVFAHELGHAFSLNHNRVSNGGDVNYEGTEVCAFGWRFLDQEFTEWRTVMATLSNANVALGKSQILNYSNPEVEFNGEPTGTIYNANANRLSQKMCAVKNYFEDEELEVAVTGPNIICNELATYTVDIVNEPASGNPGSPPYTFHWWKNNTGFFNILNGPNPPGEYLGSTQTIQIDAPANETFWLAAFVCGTDDVCANHILKVESPCEAPPPGSGGGNQAMHAAKDAAFKLFPNPAYDRIGIETSGLADGVYLYEIRNTTGQLVGSGTIDAVGSRTDDLHLPEGIASGWYMVSLTGSSFFSTQQIIITR